MLGLALGAGTCAGTLAFALDDRSRLDRILKAALSLPLDLAKNTAVAYSIV
jgi:hypothetical protein